MDNVILGGFSSSIATIFTNPLEVSISSMENFLSIISIINNNDSLVCITKGY